MNNENKIEENYQKPKKKFLSFNKKNPFERHPSVNGLLIKDDNDIPKKKEDLNFICTVVNEENESNSDNKNKDGKRNSCCVFEFKIQKIEEKLFQDEVYYIKNENVETKNDNCKEEKKIFPNNHQLYEFSEAEKKLDKEITEAIQKGEKDDTIISKIKSKV